MREINWIHIIDNKGAPIFVYENYIQGKRENNYALLSHFLYALKTVASKLRENEVKVMLIGKRKFFLIKDNVYNFVFILKSDINAEPEDINPILKEIKKAFIDKLDDELVLNIEERNKIISSFKEDLKRILRIESNIETFLK